MRRWLRRKLRQYGIEWPKTRFICPEHIKTIHFDEHWRAHVTVRRTLVFLERPEPRDLHDIIPVDLYDGDSEIDESPDAIEIARIRAKRGTRIYWTPRQPVPPYALYVHTYGWRPGASYEQLALYTEFRCDVKTGVVVLEVSAPVPIEAALAFKRPRWLRTRTERSLVKYALGQLNKPPEGVLSGDASRLEWRLSGPRLRDRYVCILFTKNGLAHWRRSLEETSIIQRVKRDIQSVLPGSTWRPADDGSFRIPRRDN